MEIKKKNRFCSHYQKAYHLCYWSTRGRGERPVQKNIFEEMTENSQVWRKPYMFRFKKLQQPKTDKLKYTTVTLTEEKHLVGFIS